MRDFRSAISFGAAFTVATASAMGMFMLGLAGHSRGSHGIAQTLALYAFLPGAIGSAAYAAGSFRTHHPHTPLLAFGLGLVGTLIVFSVLFTLNIFHVAPNPLMICLIVIALLGFLAPSMQS